MNWWRLSLCIVYSRAVYRYYIKIRVVAPSKCLVIFISKDLVKAIAGGLEMKSEIRVYKDFPRLFLFLSYQDLTHIIDRDDCLVYDVIQS